MKNLQQRNTLKN